MVQLINLFEVPAGREAEFLKLFEQVNEYMKAKPGFLGHRLHRAVLPGSQYRFVNYTDWATVEDFQDAHDDSFRSIVSEPAWLPFRSTPALYEIVGEERVS